MKIIDAHVHFSRIHTFQQTAVDASMLAYDHTGIERECQDANVIATVGMGVEESVTGAFPDHSAPDLMGLNLPNRPQTMAFVSG